MNSSFPLRFVSIAERQITITYPESQSPTTTTQPSTTPQGQTTSQSSSASQASTSSSSSGPIASLSSGLPSASRTSTSSHSESSTPASSVSSSTTSSAGLALPSTSENVSQPTNVVVPAVLGALLGVCFIASAILLFLLWRRNKRLRHELNQRHLSTSTSATGYLANYGDKSAIVDQETNEQLRQQLDQVRAELSTYAFFAPSTTRDQSNYVNNLKLLNDDIYQLSMKLKSSSTINSSSKFRTAVCTSMWGWIFSKFDPGLDQQTDEHLKAIYQRIQKRDVATLWKALAVGTFPQADMEALKHNIEADVSREMETRLTDVITTKMVELALKLSKEMAEDGKGYAITLKPGGRSFEIMVDNTTVVA